MTQTTTSSPTKGKQQPRAGLNPRIFLLSLGMFALGTDAFVVAGVLPLIARDTGVSAGLAGQLVTVFSLTYGLAAPVLAALTGRWPRNRVLMGALGLLGLTNLASALSPSFPILLCTRLLAGCFAATYTPLAFAAGIELASPKRRGLALALVVGGLNIATVLGAPLGMWIGERLGWRLSFILVAALAGIAFLSLVICGLPEAASPGSLSLRERLKPIARPRIALALLPALLWNIGVYVLYTYIAVFLQQRLHITDVSLLLACFGLGIVFANVLSALLANRFAPQRLVIIFLSTLIVIQLALPLLATTTGNAAALLLLWGMSFALLFIPQQQRLLNIGPEHANVILALNNSALYLGIAGGAALGGLALRTFAITQLGWIGTLSMFLALLIIMIAHHPDQK
ncbi:MFS transporter [Dictyobacter aurantiacus]|uniref:MFS transporter n=1 Tax=Dictyobacter aurantiacus TaxID=1936993 RepID=A0A401ZGQ6_9CHLR|nr:MFS transporter [Dictyobacter aurantiacus]GCE06065.1 MFS transporter [Dictyobacter aurantiacus]